MVSHSAHALTRGLQAACEQQTYHCEGLHSATACKRTSIEVCLQTAHLMLPVAVVRVLPVHSPIANRHVVQSDTAASAAVHEVGLLLCPVLLPLLSP